MVKSTEIRSIVHNIIWIFLERFIRVLTGITVTIWLARYLGPTQLGILTYILAVIGIVSAFSGLGLKQIVVKNLIQKIGDRTETLSSAGVLLLIAGLFSYLITITAISFLRPNDQEFLALTIVMSSILIFQAGEIFAYWFESEVKSKYVSLADSTSNIITSFLKITLIFWKAELIYFAYVFTLEALLKALFLLIAYRKYGPSDYISGPKLRNSYDLLRASWPLLIADTATLLYMKIDQVMLGNMDGITAVGWYSAAARVSEIWFVVAIAITTSVRPLLLKLAVKDPEEFKRRYQDILNLLALIGIILAVVGTFLSEQIILMLFGEKYAPASEVLKIHIWSTLFVFLNNAAWLWYVAHGKQKIASYRIFAGLFLNVLLNYFLIPTYGVIGAAFATLVSRAIVAYFGQLINKETMPLFLMMSRAMFLCMPWAIQKSFRMIKTRSRS
ncbi:flippase [Gammaproteobacteria bacterium]|nr:flippase [Gammaproteobacteria bacterium]